MAQHNEEDLFKAITEFNGLREENTVIMKETEEAASELDAVLGSAAVATVDQRPRIKAELETADLKFKTLVTLFVIHSARVKIAGAKVFKLHEELGH